MFLADLLIAEHARAEARASAAQTKMEEMQTDMERIQQAYMEQATRNEKLASAVRSGRSCWVDAVCLDQRCKAQHARRIPPLCRPQVLGRASGDHQAVQGGPRGHDHEAVWA